MKKAVTITNLAGLAFSLALGVLGGCVNLDKPSAVADCSSGLSEPCVDKLKGDAAADDATGADAWLESDAKGDAIDDVIGADQADARVPTGEDAAADTSAQPLPDALTSDATIVPDAAADATLSDLAGPDSFSAGIDAQPGSPDLRSDDGAGANNDAADALPASPDIAAPADAAVPVNTTLINFRSGKATGTAMNGYGWVTLGADDTVTSPVCGAAKAPITSAAPCASDTVWDNPNALCVTGTVPAASDYATNWGLQVGVNVKDKSPLVAGGIPFKWVGVNISGTPSSGLRLELHRHGDLEGNKYCAMLTSGALVPLARFNTQCWNDLGAAFPDADGSAVDEISVQVSPAATDTVVKGLCLEGVLLGD
jgi:hypothetical protein